MDDCRKIRAETVSRSAVCIGTSTILLCYSLAVYYNHVPAWFPMISDCAVEAPEKYPFRIGMIISACLIFLNAVLLTFYISRKEKSKLSMLEKFNNAAGKCKSRADNWCLLLAGTASMGLAIVGAVNEREDMRVHSTGAVVWFVFYEIFMVIQTFRLYRLGAQARSVKIKTIISVITFFLLVGFVTMSGDYHKYHVQIALCEWGGVGFILLFNLSCVTEFENEYVAEITWYPTPKPPTANTTTGYQPVHLMYYDNNTEGAQPYLVQQGDKVYYYA